MTRLLLAFLVLVVATPAAAQNFPQLTGRIVDEANLLTPEQEAQLTPRLEALERASSRQLVVATVDSLQGYPIEDYGYRLGRHWGIGQRGVNNGVILLVAPNERKVRIEVGYGLEPIITDALSSQIVQDRILPRFRDGDYPGGILAGVDSLAQQLQAPPEVAEQRALEAARSANTDEPAWMSALIGIFLLLFPFLPFLLLWLILRAVRHGMRGSPYRKRRRGRGPVVIWGPGWGSSWSSGSSWGGGGSWGGGSSWGGGGGFSGGGGSFGGGGASGSW